MKLTLKIFFVLLTDNVFVVFRDKCFQQSVDIPMGTNCAPLSADLFLYSYVAEFIQKLVQGERKTCCGLQFDIFSLSEDISAEHLTVFLKIYTYL